MKFWFATCATFVAGWFQLSMRHLAILLSIVLSGSVLAGMLYRVPTSARVLPPTRVGISTVVGQHERHWDGFGSGVEPHVASLAVLGQHERHPILSFLWAHSNRPALDQHERHPDWYGIGSEPTTLLDTLMRYLGTRPLG